MARRRADATLRVVHGPLDFTLRSGVRLLFLGAALSSGSAAPLARLALLRPDLCAATLEAALTVNCAHAKKTRPFRLRAKPTTGRRRRALPDLHPPNVPLALRCLRRSDNSRGCRPLIGSSVASRRSYLRLLVELAASLTASTLSSITSRTRQRGAPSSVKNPPDSRRVGRARGGARRDL